MRTRPASLATVVIAIGLALTSLGLARSLPYTVGGVGDRTTIGSDLWAHGTAVSPPIVGLVVLGLLAAIAMRPTRGGRRAAAWLAILAAVLAIAGVCEPAQREAILLGSSDPALTALAIAFHGSIVALVLSAVGEARSVNDGAGSTRAARDARAHGAPSGVAAASAA